MSDTLTLLNAPPEKLDAQVVDMHRRWPFQFLTSLLRRRGGWFANHALSANPAIASRLQSSALASRVAEIGRSPRDTMPRLLIIIGLTLAVTGCVPMTVDHTRGFSSVCEVHQVAMTGKRVRTGSTTRERYDAAYPHAAYSIKACGVPTPLWARVYVCPDCDRGYRERHGHEASDL